MISTVRRAWLQEEDSARKFGLGTPWLQEQQHAAGPARHTHGHAATRAYERFQHRLLAGPPR